MVAIHIPFAPHLSLTYAFIFSIVPDKLYAFSLPYCLFFRPLPLQGIKAEAVEFLKAVWNRKGKS